MCDMCPPAAATGTQLQTDMGGHPASKKSKAFASVAPAARVPPLPPNKPRTSRPDRKTPFLGAWAGMQWDTCASVHMPPPTHTVSPPHNQCVGAHTCMPSCAPRQLAEHIVQYYGSTTPRCDASVHPHAKCCCVPVHTVDARSSTTSAHCMHRAMKAQLNRAGTNAQS